MAPGVFRIEPASAGVVHLVMEDPARKLNVLDEAAIASLEDALTTLEAQRGELKGVILRSGKKGSYIAGADITQIGALTELAAIHTLVRRGQSAFQRLATLGVPTVAAIDGVCLGGGLEISLACDSRVAAEEKQTSIGLPETMLGIFPGFGGTTRLPRLIGYRNALDLILSARNLDAKRAEKMGVIAKAAPSAWLIEAAEKRLAEIARRPAGARADRYRPKAALDHALEGNPLGRAFLFRQARASVMARTSGHYPAPLAAIDCLQRCVGLAVEDALVVEAERVSPMVASDVCKNLVRIFFLSEAAKRAEVVPGSPLAPQAVRGMMLAGAGVMGGGIAELASRYGIDVRLRDVRPESLQTGLATVRRVLDERGRKKRTPAREKDGQMAHILPTLELTGMARVDLALEAVVEDLDVKRRVFAEIEVRIRQDALLASNTSSLSIDALADGLRHPERFVGFHFFNPVHKMPLVEVIRGARTGDQALINAVALARKLGKTPVVVKDSPGFLVNRVLMPYLREAMHLLEEGYAVTDIDASMRRFGMPMGPFEVIDEVGLDVGMKVAAVLAKAFPERMQNAPLLEKLVAAGRLGKKNGLGFYRHQGKKRRVDDSVRVLLGLPAARKPQVLDTLAERMVMAMVNETARCVEEGLVSGAGQADLGLIFGAGFPPFRGGPLRHADAVGLAFVVQRLQSLRAEKGPRFEPCALLVAKAAAGERFTALVG